MKRIGLVSDSHGNLNSLKKAVDQMGPVDLIIHTGDYITDGDTIKTWSNIPVLSVKGNMDSYERDRPNFLKTNIEGHNIYAAHGHRDAVKLGTEQFAQTVKSNGCDIGIYGHTHRKDLDKINDVILINPGSCSLPNDNSKSFAILELDGPKIDVRFYELED